MTVGPPATAAGVACCQLSVVVASRNAVKINAVAAALKRALPGVKHHVTGADSQSGVADQPFGDQETLRGACNRVASICLPQHQGCLLVAIEGGVGFQEPLPPSPALLGTDPGLQAQDAQQLQQQQQRRQQRREQALMQQQGGQQQAGTPLPGLECFAWVVVQAPGGATSQARTATFPLPPAISELMLRDGLELGDADDAVFGRVKSGRGNGTIGLLTSGLLTRQSYYEHAALCALVPLINPQLYPGFALAAGSE